MRALWRRAAQTPGTCRCISRVAIVPQAGRRGGRARLGGAWAFGTPAPTFVHNSVKAAGLAGDAQAKQSRRRQWDEACARLAEAMDRRLAREGDTASTAAGSGRADERHGYHGLALDELPEDIDWNAIQRAAGMELVDDHILGEQEVPLLPHHLADTAWDDLRFDSRLPGTQALEWPVHTGRPVARHHLPPQSLWAHDAVRLTAMRRRHTWKKLAMQELSTGLLCHTLLSRVDFARFSKSPLHLQSVSPQIQDIASFTNAQIKQARAEILETMEKLHVTHVESSAERIAKANIHVDQPGMPRYLQDADGDFYGICQQMNTGIKHLLKDTATSNDRKEALAVAKICHNLLVSTAAPDLQTFNLLVAGFKRWRRPRMVDDVIAAFHASKIRPNEIACREILGHYTNESRPNDFSRFVARMRGVGDALMLANPDITINEAGQDRLIRIDDHKVYQKVHPTPMVFSALISGVMKFAGFDRALDIYYEMKADGWGLDMGGLTTLLGDCIRRADWEGGLYLWEEISSIKAEAKPKDMAKAYHHMLSLCSVTGNTVTFNQVLGELVKRGFDQKSILHAATRTTEAARWKKGGLAPAWAADNVMIAVAGYVGDAKTSAPKSEPESFVDDALFTQQTPDLADLSGDELPMDPKEAWASWVEAEFGEKPTDPEP